MTVIPKKSLYEAAWSFWGEKQQIVMVMEECAELQQAVSKYLRGKTLRAEMAEEIADVEIMLEQLRHMFNLDKNVDYHKEKKLERLNKTLVEAGAL